MDEAPVNQGTFAVGSMVGISDDISHSIYESSIRNTLRTQSRPLMYGMHRRAAGSFQVFGGNTLDSSDADWMPIHKS